MKPSAQIWALALAGPLIGFLHLVGVYSLASLEEGPPALTGLTIRLAMAATTTVSVLANLALIMVAWTNRLPQLAKEPDAEASRFWRAVIGIGAAISAATVLFQGLPALVIR